MSSNWVVGKDQKMAPRRKDKHNNKQPVLPVVQNNSDKWIDEWKTYFNGEFIPSEKSQPEPSTSGTSGTCRVKTVPTKTTEDMSSNMVVAKDQKKAPRMEKHNNKQPVLPVVQNNSDKWIDEWKTYFNGEFIPSEKSQPEPSTSGTSGTCRVKTVPTKTTEDMSSNMVVAKDQKKAPRMEKHNNKQPVLPVVQNNSDKLIREWETYYNDEFIPSKKSQPEPSTSGTSGTRRVKTAPTKTTANMSSNVVVAKDQKKARKDKHNYKQPVLPVVQNNSDVTVREHGGCAYCKARQLKEFEWLEGKSDCLPDLNVMFGGNLMEEEDLATGAAVSQPSDKLFCDWETNFNDEFIPSKKSQPKPSTSGTSGTRRRRVKSAPTKTIAVQKPTAALLGEVDVCTPFDDCNKKLFDWPEEIIDITEKMNDNMVAEIFCDEDAVNQQLSLATPVFARPSESELRMTDAMEYICEDGDYWVRIINDRTSCFLCPWVAPTFLLEAHVRTDHLDQIVKKNSHTWSKSINFSSLVNQDVWQSHVTEYNSTLYILSFKYEEPDHLMVSLTNLTYLYTSHWGKITIFNKATGEPHRWEGPIQEVTNMIRGNVEGLTVELSKLKLLSKSPKLKLVNKGLVPRSQRGPVKGKPELDDICIVVFVNIFNCALNEQDATV